MQATQRLSAVVISPVMFNENVSQDIVLDEASVCNRKHAEAEVQLHIGPEPGRHLSDYRVRRK